jgi:diaminopimelate epimerase
MAFSQPRRPSDSEEFHRLFQETAEVFQQSNRLQNESERNIASMRLRTKLESLLNIREGCNFIVPGGNTTLLLEGKQYEDDLRHIAKNAMEQGIVEQVGRISTKADALYNHEMPYANGYQIWPNGEFCLNGVRSQAALMHAREHQTCPIHIHCSGREEPIECACKDEDYAQGVISVEARLKGLHPTYEPLEEKQKRGEGPVLVTMEGISHFLIPVLQDELDTKNENDVRGLMKKYADRIKGAPAVGGIFFAQSARGISIRPIVYSITFMNETACGSGTAALALYLYCLDAKKTILQVRQPSDEIFNTTILPDEDSDLVDLHVESKVRIVHDCKNAQSNST